MRIIGGYLKGSKLYLPEDDKTRPLKDLVRESIFNLINHSNKIMIKLYQTDVLDVYAGTGSFGLECLSRGSKNIAFIENNNNSIKILEKNIDKLKVKAKTKLIQGDALKVINNDGNFKKTFNIIFCDPPYKDENIKKIIHLIYKKKLLKKKGIIILHRNKKTIDNLPDFFDTVEIRNYGISKIIFGRFLS
jgi:16S rRNA (guanine966-N2)-methyltransferase